MIMQVLEIPGSVISHGNKALRFLARSGRECYLTTTMMEFDGKPGEEMTLLAEPSVRIDGVVVMFIYRGRKDQ
jgi:hypothetical protein